MKFGRFGGKDITGYTQCPKLSRLFLENAPYLTLENNITDKLTPEPVYKPESHNADRYAP